VRKPKKNYNEECAAAIERSINMTVPWFLITCYAYYHLNESLLTDEYFDSMCATMIKRWKQIQHPHKSLVDLNQLAAGSGFTLQRKQYPGMARGAAELLIREMK
jgi:hypothetical protein